MQGQASGAPGHLHHQDIMNGGTRRPRPVAGAAADHIRLTAPAVAAWADGCNQVVTRAAGPGRQAGADEQACRSPVPPAFPASSSGDAAASAATSRLMHPVPPAPIRPTAPPRLRRRPGTSRAVASKPAPAQPAGGKPNHHRRLAKPAPIRPPAMTVAVEDRMVSPSRLNGNFIRILVLAPTVPGVRS